MVLVKIGTQNPKNRRAARAKTLIFLRDFNDFGENGNPKNRRASRAKITRNTKGSR